MPKYLRSMIRIRKPTCGALYYRNLNFEKFIARSCRNLLNAKAFLCRRTTLAAVTLLKQTVKVHHNHLKYPQDRSK